MSLPAVTATADAVGEVLGGRRLAGFGRDRSERDLHAPVLEGVVGVDGLFGVVRVVLVIQLELNAAGRVDLVDGDLRAVLGGIAVNGGASRQRSRAAQLEGTGAEGAAGRHGGGENECEYVLFHRVHRAKHPFSENLQSVRFQTSLPTRKKRELSPTAWGRGAAPFPVDMKMNYMSGSAKSKLSTALK